jgi:hypothetical protein
MGVFTLVSQSAILYFVTMNLPKLPLMNQVLSLALRANTEELVKLLSRFDYPEFNKKPADGGWSAGEVAEHLLLFDIRTTSVLGGALEPTDRDPQDQIGAIAERLRNPTKINAPDALIPSDSAKEPLALIDKIRKQRSLLIGLVEKRDMNHIVLDHTHRLFGQLTGVEWINLTVFHCERHLLQLKKLI